MNIKYIFSALLLFVFAGVLFAQKAPDFSLLDVNGNTVKLSDFKGKTVFIDFWATWCPPCRDSIPAVKNVHKQFASNPNFVLLGINLGEKPSTVINFIKDNAMKYNVLLGDKKTAELYAVSAIPSFFIVDKNGNIVKNYRGYNSALESEWLAKIREELAK